MKCTTNFMYMLGAPERYEFEFRQEASNIEALTGADDKKSVREQAKKFITSHSTNLCWKKHCPLPHPPVVYFFFRAHNHAIPIPFAEAPYAFIPVLPEKYGFTSTVKITPEREQFQLSPESQEVYEQLIKRSSTGLHDLAESVGSIINESMRYDFLWAKLLAPIGRHTFCQLGYFKEVQDTYPRTGREAFTGICTDAGREIRKLLRSLHIEDIVYTSVCTEVPFKARGHDHIVYHETIALIDRRSGEWEVINPTNRLPGKNAVPKSELARFGRTYKI